MSKKPSPQQVRKAVAKVEDTARKADPISDRADGERLADQRQTAWDAMQIPRSTWDDKESLLMGSNRDSASQDTKSQVNDPRLATIVIERAARVMAQLPSGKVQALTLKDTGKNTLMNLVLNRYVYPNANSQFDLLTKFRMWDIYAGMYGSMPMLADYRISKEYIGPDCYLVPIRNFIPQAGPVSIGELDHCFIDTWVSVDWLQSRNPKTWKNLDTVIAKAREKGASPSTGDQQHRSLPGRTLYPNIPGGRGKAGMVLLSTRYERDRWVTFAPDHDNLVVRDIDNPQQNHRIPIVMKHCFPLLDSIIGLGEFERGKSLQFAINSLINLYLDGVKMSIFPPVMINPDGVIPSSIRFNPAAKWLVTQPNAVQPFNVSPEGIQTFQSTYSFLVAALLNMAGTTDTSVSSKTDPGLGKTPDALKMLSARESARDNWDRFMMEKAIEDLTGMMIDMVATKQEAPIKFDLFADEIKQIARENPDVLEMVKVSATKGYGKATIAPQELTDTKYRFFIDSGTSMKQDDERTNAVATQLLMMILQAPQLLQAMKASKTPRTVDIGELFETIVNTSGLPNAQKIVTDLPGGDPNAPQDGQNPQQPQGGDVISALMPQQQPQTEPQKVSESISFKDLPPEGQAQMAAQVGIQLDPAALEARQQMQAGVAGQPPAPQTQGMPQGAPMPQFKNPEIAALAQHIMNGGGNG